MTARLTPYLMFDGNATEAIQFYKEALNAEVLAIQTYGDMGGVPEEMKDLVAHAMVKVGESDLMFSDSPGQPPQKGNQVTICISVTDVDQAKQIFEALQEGGEIHHPLEKTQFSPAFGTLTDKFGVTFNIVTDYQ